MGGNIWHWVGARRLSVTPACVTRRLKHYPFGCEACDLPGVSNNVALCCSFCCPADITGGKCRHNAYPHVRALVRPNSSCNHGPKPRALHVTSKTLWMNKQHDSTVNLTSTYVAEHDRNTVSDDPSSFAPGYTTGPTSDGQQFAVKCSSP